MGDIDRVLRSNLKLKHLQLIVALDEFRHLGRSAEFLALTQPAVSKSLAEIERMFGLALFNRSTRGTEPTAYGEKVVRFARAVLADFDRTRQDIATIHGGAAERIRLGAMVVAVPGLVAEAVARLKAALPQTTVAIEEGDLSRLLPRLRVGELDFIVGRLEPGYAAPDLEAEPLYTEAMCVVVSATHPLAGRPAAQAVTRAPASVGARAAAKAAARVAATAAATAAARKPAQAATAIDWADLAGLPWVVPPAWASSRLKLQQMFFKHRLEPPGDVVESASFLVTLTFLRQRACVAFVAAEVARYLEREGLATTLPLAVPIELPPVGLLQLRNGLRTPAAERLLAELRSAAQARPGAVRTAPASG